VVTAATCRRAASDGSTCAAAAPAVNSVRVPTCTRSIELHIRRLQVLPVCAKLASVSVNDDGSGVGVE
jgi:hypothetical protein